MEVKNVISGNNEKNNLGNLKVGQVGKVEKITCTGAIKRRIMDMGITKGVNIEVIGFAPLGDPMKLKVRGYELSIRKSEASNIIVV